MDDVEEYDLVVIGSGPAGEKGAAQAAYFGKKVAIIEKSPFFGGASTNTGTLPSKTLRETALYLSGFRQRGLYGIEANLVDQASVSDFLYHERSVKETERERIKKNIMRHNMVPYRGTAHFIDKHHIKVVGRDSATLYGKYFLITTGSSPHRPENYNFEERGIYDSDTILDLKYLPKSMAIIGAGVIGIEYACVFASLGTPVILIDRRDRLLSFLDYEIAKTLLIDMQEMGIKLFTKKSVIEVDKIKSRGKPSFMIHLDSGEKLEIDTVLITSGRVSNTKELKLENAGVPTGKRGIIEVNDCFRTVVPHIYAAGDVIGFPALASTSMEQARLAMCDAFKLTYKKELAQNLPYGLYTIPEISYIGDTEQQAQEKGIDYVVGRAYYEQNAKGQIIGDKHGFLKLLFDEKMKLIGAHMIGENATELIHLGVTTLLMGGGAELFITTCFNYPSLSEMYKYATYDAMGIRQTRQRLPTHKSF